MSEVSNFLDSVSGPKYNTGLRQMQGVDVAPIVGLNGYNQNSQLPGAFSSALPSSTTSRASAPASTPASNIGPSSGVFGNFGGGNTGFDSNSGTSFSNSGGANNSGLGNAISGLGMLGNLTHDPTISQAAGLAGAGYGAMNGNYTGLGGYIGRAFSNSPYGSLVGALGGNFLSPDTSTSKFAANALLGLGIPGYGVVNSLTGGWLGDSLFGSDAQKNALGQTTIAATPGLLGNLGWNNDNANTTQQDFRTSEINAQNGGYGGGGGMSGAMGGFNGGNGLGSNGIGAGGHDPG